MGNEASTFLRSQTIGRNRTVQPASNPGSSTVRPATIPTNLQKIPDTEVSVHFEGYRDLPLLLAVVNDETDHSAYDLLRADLLRSVRWAAYGKAGESSFSRAEAKTALLQTIGAIQPKVLLAHGKAAETVVEALTDRSLLVPAVILIQPPTETLSSAALREFQGHLLVIASGATLQEPGWEDLAFPLAASFTKSGIAGSGSHPERENPSSVNAVIAANLRKLRSTDALS